MDLSYGPEYQSFRQEIRAFLADHAEAAPRAGLGVAAGRGGSDLKAWQLLEGGISFFTADRD